jgi:hypothetical protein
MNDDLSRVLAFPVKIEDGKVLVDAATLDYQPAPQYDSEDEEEVA